MSRKRAQHSAAFKAKVALAALKETRTVSELAGQFGVHPTQVHKWKRQMLQGAETLFLGPRNWDERLGGGNILAGGGMHATEIQDMPSQVKLRSRGGRIAKNLAGETFGDLIYLRDAGRSSAGKLLSEVLCNKCGSKIVVQQQNLQSGNTTSCESCGRHKPKPGVSATSKRRWDRAAVFTRDGKRYYALRKAAKYVGVGTQSILDWASDGCPRTGWRKIRIEHFKVGVGRRRSITGYLVDDLDEIHRLMAETESNAIPHVRGYTHIDEAIAGFVKSSQTFYCRLKSKGIKPKRFYAERANGSPLPRSYVPNWFLEQLGDEWKGVIQDDAKETAASATAASESSAPRSLDPKQIKDNVMRSAASVTTVLSETAQLPSHPYSVRVESISVEAAATIRKATFTPANNTDESVEQTATPQYVTLNQAAAMVNRSKKTLEREKNKPQTNMPKPESEGGGGKPDEWLWTTLRPWLEKSYGKMLPAVFPKHI